MHDVIIIGGGPVGSYLACKLAKAGLDTLVLEKRKRVGEAVCCTGIVSQDCFDAFDFDSNLILRKANSAKVFSPTGKIIRLWRQENQAYIIDRAALNMSMYEKAKTVGVRYIFNSIAEDIKPEKERITVVSVIDGKDVEYTARVVVLAAGFGSKFINRLGLGESGDFVVGAQVEVTNTNAEEIEVYMGGEVAPGFFAWLVPTSAQKALVGLLSRRDPKKYLEKLLFLLKAEGKIDFGDFKMDSRGITVKPPAKTYSRRLIVVGDAAGQVKPTTGGGIYFGLLSAEIAARNLINALEKNDFSAKQLSSYQKEWKKELGDELNICYWSRKLYEKLSDTQIDKIFDITINNSLDKVLLEANDLSFDWHGGVILRLARQKALTKPLKAMRIPLKSIVNR